MRFSFERLCEDIKGYENLCNTIMSLASSGEVKVILNDILRNGSYQDFTLNTNNMNRDNADIEARRRLSTAYLLLKNPDSFYKLVENKINLFHGTNANALSSIIKYGLNSHEQSINDGIDVSTGEKTIYNSDNRKFVSLTDDLETAQEYSSIKPTANNELLSFPIVIGTSIDNLKNLSVKSVDSTVPEIGVMQKLPTENINSIFVPSEKVNFVQKIVNHEHILVLPMDDFDDKFYYIEDSIVIINEEKLNNFKDNINKNTKVFYKEELKVMAYSRCLSKIKEKIGIFTQDKELEHGRKYK